MQTVFIAGMPRCGSMWTYNIARSLIRASGRTLIPETVVVDESVLLKEFSNSPPPNVDFFCIKTHYCITPLDTSQVKIICNYRDVRDAMLSFQRFTHCTFEQAIEAVKGMMEITDHYLNLGSQENILKIRYEEVVEEPFYVAQRINQFLDLGVSGQDEREIVQEFSKSNILNKLRHINLTKVKAMMEYLGKRPSLYELVENFDGSHRVFLKSTGFQTNHITDTKVGEWQTVLSAEEQEILISLTSSWLARHQYSESY